ncbi:hypothetical protein COB21_00565 [Candidatus Aerophobetes bacterium]|uniref:RNA-binding protein KhpA n=1 Tax=Aerophobetes bacterium TaxID=2030807 RepID=A0A2A4X8N9_UNCAE|nr:MAG: hypothetical protein COB21_00565 [Candidatus Aerophobetes bacterium]
MNTFLEYIVKNLVDNADAVKVDLIESDSGSLIEIRVAKEDIAKVIGREGRMIKALRLIMGTVAAKLSKKVRVEIIQ